MNNPESKIKIENTFKLAEKVAEIKKEEEKKIPYQLNIIDELHINENGHSRVLCKLLNYRDLNNNTPVYLLSLLKYIKEKYGSTNNDWAKLSISNNCIITQEKKRIDLWVTDKNKNTGYAIIIENKIYDANDQDNQIARYIETTLNEGFEDDHIFVIYFIIGKTKSAHL